MQDSKSDSKNRASEEAQKVLVIHITHKSFTKNEVGISPVIGCAMTPRTVNYLW
jgi:hypothetical protein